MAVLSAAFVPGCTVMVGPDGSKQITVDGFQAAQLIANILDDK